MKMTHSPEPWRTGKEESAKGRLGWERLIFSEAEKDPYLEGEDQQVAEASMVRLTLDKDPIERASANAERIVHCINACTGIPNNTLEDLVRQRDGNKEDLFRFQYSVGLIDELSRDLKKTQKQLKLYQAKSIALEQMLLTVKEGLELMPVPITDGIFLRRLAWAIEVCLKNKEKDAEKTL